MVLLTDIFRLLSCHLWTPLWTAPPHLQVNLAKVRGKTKAPTKEVSENFEHLEDPNIETNPWWNRWAPKKKKKLVLSMKYWCV